MTNIDNYLKRILHNRKTICKDNSGMCNREFEVSWEIGRKYWNIAGGGGVYSGLRPREPKQA